MRDTAHSVFAATTPAWRPGVAHLSGDDAKKKDAAEAPAKTNEKLDAIEKEVEAIEHELVQRAKK